MPGNGGILPDQRSLSVPVLMPLQSTSTTISSGAGSPKGKRLSASCPGPSITTASAFNP